ncbi:MAG: S1 RNA-binding domain-containing protein [Armatimonadetes bacterium]|nr:S1 RNA-binding domain-containing protein [Armatimonadota bacterium]
MTTDEKQTPEESAVIETAAAEETAATDAVTAETEVTTSEPAESAAAPAVEAAADEAPAPEAQAEATPAADPAPQVPAETVAEPATASSGKPGMTEDERLFEEAMAILGGEDTDSGPTLSKGERIEAKVIQVENDRVFVDLGTKAEGIVPLAELANEKLESAIGHVKPGDTFQVIVLKTHSAEGNPVVSKRKADFDVQWQRILDSFESGELFDANVVDRVKGGLVVDIGVRGFVPATHVGNGKLRNIEKYVGQILPVKIIEVDRERKKVVLSNKAAEDERRDEVRANIFERVKPGEVMEGTVRRLTDYGAFVDLGGVDGLLHISEMSWMRIDHPREVLKEGEDIKVMVLRLDEGGGRISLGLRQVLPDPWNLIREHYKQGEKIKVVVNRMVQAGAFVRLPEGAEAFLPVGEISDERIQKPQDALEEQQEIEPTIIDLRPDERRMVLSLRSNPQIGGYRMDPSVGAAMRGGQGGQGGQGGHGGRDFRDGGGKRRGGTKFRQPAEDTAPSQRVATGGATIGERLGLLKGLVRPEASGETEEPGE